MKLNNTILNGDCLSILKQVSEKSFQMVVTSPPYFGHRKYSKHEELAIFEIGRESDVEIYIHNLVRIFSEIRRTLKDDGVLWLNLGDTYRDNELLAVPWRLALALKADGWILRSEVIWNKPNAMPSSIKTRPTTSHEHIFMFSKCKEYFYDADAIREPHVTFSEKSKMKGGRNHFGKRGGTPEHGKFGGASNLHNGRWDQAFHPKGRNKRTVWDVSLGKCRDAHFAVFPPKLIEICIRATSRVGDLVMDPFMGSGTTAVVAKNLDRNFCGIELIPEYIEIIKKRIATETMMKVSSLTPNVKSNKKSISNFLDQLSFVH